MFPVNSPLLRPDAKGKAERVPAGSVDALKQGRIGLAQACKQAILHRGGEILVAQGIALPSHHKAREALWMAACQLAPAYFEEIVAAISNGSFDADRLLPDTKNLIARLDEHGWRALDAYARAQSPGCPGIRDLILTLDEQDSLTRRSCGNLAQLPALQRLTLRLARLDRQGAPVEIDLRSLPVDTIQDVAVEGASFIVVNVHSDRRVPVRPVGLSPASRHERYIGGELVESIALAVPPEHSVAAARIAQGPELEIAGPRGDRAAVEAEGRRRVVQVLRDCAVPSSIGSVITPAEAEVELARVTCAAPRMYADTRSFGGAVHDLLATMDRDNVPYRNFVCQLGSQLMGMRLVNLPHDPVRYRVQIFDPATAPGLPDEPAIIPKEVLRREMAMFDAWSLDMWLTGETLAAHSSAPGATRICAIWDVPEPGPGRKKEGKTPAPGPIADRARPQWKVDRASCTPEDMASAALQCGDAPSAATHLRASLERFNESALSDHLYSPASTLRMGYGKAMRSGRAKAAETYLQAILGIAPSRLSSGAKCALLRGNALEVDGRRVVLSPIASAISHGQQATTTAFASAVAGCTALSPDDKVLLLLAQSHLDKDGMPAGPPVLHRVCARDPGPRDAGGSAPARQPDVIHAYLSTALQSDGLSLKSKREICNSGHEDVAAARVALDKGNVAEAAAMVCAVLEAAPSQPVTTQALLEALGVSPQEVLKAMAGAAPPGAKLPGWGGRIQLALEAAERANRPALATLSNQPGRLYEVICAVLKDPGMSEPAKADFLQAKVGAHSAGRAAAKAGRLEDAAAMVCAVLDSTPVPKARRERLSDLGLQPDFVLKQITARKPKAGTPLAIWAQRLRAVPGRALLDSKAPAGARKPAESAAAPLEVAKADERVAPRTLFTFSDDEADALDAYLYQLLARDALTNDMRKVCGRKQEGLTAAQAAMEAGNLRAAAAMVHAVQRSGYSRPFHYLHVTPEAVLNAITEKLVVMSNAPASLEEARDLKAWAKRIKSLMPLAPLDAKGDAKASVRSGSGAGSASGPAARSSAVPRMDDKKLQASLPQDRHTYTPSPQQVMNWVKHYDFIDPDLEVNLLPFTYDGKGGVYVPAGDKVPHIHIGAGFATLKDTQGDHHELMVGDVIHQAAPRRLSRTQAMRPCSSSFTTYWVRQMLLCGFALQGRSA